MSFDTLFYKTNFAPFVFVRFYFTQLSVFINAADHEIHQAVLKKKPYMAFTVWAAIHFGVWAPFLGYQCIEITFSSKIQTNFFFHVVLSKPQHVKSLRHRNLPYSDHLKGFFNFTCKQPWQYSNPKPHTLTLVIYIYDWHSYMYVATS